MTVDVSPELAIALNSWLGGVTVFGGLACLGIWLYDRELRAFLWTSLLALVITLGLISGAIVAAQPSAGVTLTASFVRTTLFGVGAVFAVHTICVLQPGLSLRGLERALVGLIAVRLALWFPTHLFTQHRVDAAGWPVYGPLVWTAGFFNVGVIAAGALAVRRSSGRIRLAALGYGLVVAVLSVAPKMAHDRLLVEEIMTLNALPGGVAILFLAGRALLRNARGHDTLVRRQDLLVRLSQAAVTDPVDTVRRTVERELRTELGRDVKVAISDHNRFPQPGTTSGTVRVQGRRQHAAARGLGSVSAPTRQFVESALRALLAASERARSDAETAHAAIHDPHTGLLTLASFTARLDDRLHNGDEAAMVLVLCRLSGLGQLAAVDGQAQVDSVLMEVTAAINGLRRSRTTVARVSTESFGIAEQVAPADADQFLTDRLAEIRAAVPIARPSIQLTLGAACADAGATAASLLSNAAVALERAATGGDSVFDDAAGAHVRGRAALERDLALALDRDEIEVQYQPVFSVADRSVVAVEALARWRRAGNLTPPDLWIPAAERNGLIHKIDQRVLEIAARDQKRLGVPVAVNVSPLELAERFFTADVLRAIGSCPPGQVILEMTETAVMADLDRSVAILQELRSHGIRIALDDFGSSYSSLAALAVLPVDILKLDSSFVTRLEQPDGVKVVAAVIALGRSLGKPIVAEGVETDAQLSLLASLDVDRVQGYLLGRPVPVHQLAGMLGDATGAPRRLFVVGPVAEVG